MTPADARGTARRRVEARRYLGVTSGAARDVESCGTARAAIERGIELARTRSERLGGW
ncbi:hypothetical protein L6R52_32005 [Myxococcota bacterium]|nr:hypothetical protein [Myxococcota bacterium]